MTTANDFFSQYATGYTPDAAATDFWNQKIASMGEAAALNEFLNPADPNAPRMVAMRMDSDFQKATGALPATAPNLLPSVENRFRTPEAKRAFEDKVATMFQSNFGRMPSTSELGDWTSKAQAMDMTAQGGYSAGDYDPRHTLLNTMQSMSNAAATQKGTTAPQMQTPVTPGTPSVLNRSAINLASSGAPLSQVQQASGALPGPAQQAPTSQVSGQPQFDIMSLLRNLGIGQQGGQMPGGQMGASPWSIPTQQQIRQPRQNLPQSPMGALSRGMSLDPLWFNRQRLAALQGQASGMPGGVARPAIQQQAPMQRNLGALGGWGQPAEMYKPPMQAGGGGGFAPRPGALDQVGVESGGYATLPGSGKTYSSPFGGGFNFNQLASLLTRGSASPDSVDAERIAAGLPVY